MANRSGAPELLAAMGCGHERLWEPIEAYAEAVRPVRELDTSYQDDDAEEVFDAKLEIDALDTGLVFPAFIARLILTHDPDSAEAAAIGRAFDELGKLDAINRAAKVVETVHASGFIAAQPGARRLADELTRWVEATAGLPEIQPALLAHRADPLPVNQQGLTR